MIDPYAILNVSSSADDEAIRQAYLEQVRRFPAERYPQRFQRIRSAYEQLRSQRDRLRHQLFASDPPTLLCLLEQLQVALQPGRPNREQFSALLRIIPPPRRD